MRIHLDFKGVVMLFEALNHKKELDLDLAPAWCTLKEVVDLLARRFGTPLKKALLDQDGHIDLEIRVVLNQNTQLVENRMQTMLHDGDTLSFLVAT